MLLRLLPLVTGLLPVFAIHASYAIAIAAERVPRCLPYLDGCTSISATGRYEPASFVFKPAMLSEAMLLLVYWLCATAWLRALDEAAGRRPTGTAHVAVIGGAGAIALTLYVTFLGTQQPFYEFMRRFGIYGFFLFTIVAQLAVSWRARSSAVTSGDAGLQRIVALQFLLALVPFLLGALNLVLKAVLADADAAENVIEWLVVMLMQAWFVLGYFAWRRSGFTARFETLPPR